MVLSLCSWEVCVYFTMLTSCTAKPILLLKWFGALWTLVSNHAVSWPRELVGRSWRSNEEVKEECVMTLLKEENAQSKFNPSSYVETCLCVSVLILTSVLLNKPSLWMLKLSTHWLVYKARLLKKTQISRWSVLIHHVIILEVCVWWSRSTVTVTSTSVQHRELLGFLGVMVK